MKLFAFLLAVVGCSAYQGRRILTVPDDKACLRDRLNEATECAFETCTLYSDYNDCVQDLANCRAQLTSGGGGAQAAIVQRDMGDMSESFIFATTTPTNAYADLVSETSSNLGVVNDPSVVKFTFTTGESGYDMEATNDLELERAFNLQNQWQFYLVLTASQDSPTPTQSPSNQPTSSPTPSPVEPQYNCAKHFELGARRSGSYFINPEDPFLVKCVFEDNNGWIELSMRNNEFNQDYIVVGGYSASNNFHKCQDAMDDYYDFLFDDYRNAGEDGEGKIRTSDVAGHFGDSNSQMMDIGYFNPETGEDYTAEQIEYIREVSGVLNDNTPIVCTEADADNNNLQSEETGHEMELYAADGELLICTPCAGRNCEWNRNENDGEDYGNTVEYVWRTSTQMEVNGFLANRNEAACVDHERTLPPKFIMPAQARARIATGGGTTFGYPSKTFKVTGPPAALMASCSDFAQQGYTTAGQYLINLADPFYVECHFEDGVGWIALEMRNRDYQQDWIALGAHSVANSFQKCSDNVDTLAFPFICDSLGVSPNTCTEDQIQATDVQGFYAVTEENYPGALRMTIDYKNPGTGEIYTESQVAYLRGILMRIHDDTPLICLEADADNVNGQDDYDSIRGHEMILIASDESTMNCTPCHSGNCNSSDGQSAVYRWRTSQAPEITGQVDDNQCSGHQDALLPKFILPTMAEARIGTGGGVAFGYADKVFYVTSDRDIKASCAEYGQSGITVDGPYMINNDDPFEVECVFDSDGQGWMRVSLINLWNDQKYIAGGSYNSDNTFYKCADSLDDYIDFIHDTVSENVPETDNYRINAEDLQVTFSTRTMNIGYFNPRTEEMYTDAQVEYLRSITTMLNPNTPLTCVEADADTSPNGHDMILTATDGDTMNCTPCTSTNCHVGVDGTSMIIRWRTSEDAEIIGNPHGNCANPGVLDPKFIFPVSARAEINTGGGSTFSYKDKEFQVA